MMLHHRKFLGLAAAAVGCLAFSPPTSALDYPTRPVHFIVSFAAGGPNDTIARMLGHRLPSPGTGARTERVVQATKVVRKTKVVGNGEVAADATVTARKRSTRQWR